MSSPNCGKVWFAASYLQWSRCTFPSLLVCEKGFFSLSLSHSEPHLSLNWWVSAAGWFIAAVYTEFFFFFFVCEKILNDIPHHVISLSSLFPLELALLLSSQVKEDYGFLKRSWLGGAEMSWSCCSDTFDLPKKKRFPCWRHQRDFGRK